MAEPDWDVFISYSRSDAGWVDAVHDALADAGLRVFRDAGAIAPGESIGGRIRAAVEGSRLLLACYSHEYATRRSCQEELRLAFLAGQREGDPTRRVLVVNPERSAEHIEPIHLRDTLHLAPSDSAALAAAVRARLAVHPAAIGAAPRVAPSLPPSVPRGAPAATRRVQAGWALHSALHPGVGAVAPGADRAVAVVHGAPGSGRSSFVADYVRCFAGCFPGGVFWLSADPRRWDEQLREAARRLGVALDGESPGAVPREVSAALERLPDAALWVVDDVPAGLPVERAAALVAPVCAVLVSGDARHGELGEPVALGGLAPDVARAVLGSADAALAELVGGHPATLARVGALVRSGGVEHALDALGDPGCAVWREAGAAFEADIAATGTIGADALRALAAVHPEPLRSAALRAAVDADREAFERSLGELVARSLVTSEGELGVEPVVAHAVRAIERDPARAARVRRLALRVLRAQGARPSAPGTADARQAAHRLRTEIVHRVPARRLGPEQGSAREALSSMYELFRTARDTVAALDPDAADVGRPSVEELVERLLEEILSPFLADWHPRLSDWERTRPDGVPPLAHERSWPEHAALRERLGALRAPVLDVADGLRAISVSR